jgi:hypothetical protein
MPVNNSALQKRVENLEKQLREVQTELAVIRRTAKTPWWERLAGTFKNDPRFDEVAAAGRAYRRSLATRKRP